MENFTNHFKYCKARPILVLRWSTIQLRSTNRASVISQVLGHKVVNGINLAEVGWERLRCPEQKSVTFNLILFCFGLAYKVFEHVIEIRCTPVVES